MILRAHSPLLCLQAFTEDSRTALRSMQHPDEDKTVLACGCYSAGPRNLGAAGDQARFEHCLMINDGERVRIVQELKQDRGAWKASTVEVSCLQAVQVDAGHLEEGEWAFSPGGPRVPVTTGLWHDGIACLLADLRLHVCKGTEHLQWSMQHSRACLSSSAWTALHTCSPCRCTYVCQCILMA